MECKEELKSRSTDDREKFIKSLIINVKILNLIFLVWIIFNQFGPINILRIYLIQKWVLILSRGTPIKYYSSDRITQIIGNGLVLN